MSWILSRRDYQALIEDARVLTRAGKHVKVMTLADGDLLKLFWLRRSLSSGWIYPYSLRFAHNARRLIDLGIPSVQVKATHYIPTEHLHVARYAPLPGETLYTLPLDSYLTGLAEFLAMLHHQGIYFRSLHLANVLRLEDGKFGLIDVADLTFKHRRLTPPERVRNLLHILRREDNRDRFEWAGLVELLEAYLRACEALGDERGLGPKVEQFKIAAKGQF